jgi:S1-C subfamily serine protease
MLDCDWSSDVCSSDLLKPIAFGDSRKARVCDVVYTLGNASNSLINNDQPSFNVGLISAAYRLDKPRAGAIYTGTVFETTAAVNIGIEGGPLLDSAGRMIGMLTLNYSPHRFLGTAIPIDEIKDTIELLKEGKHSSQATAKPVEQPAETGEGYFGARVVDQGGRLVIDSVDAGSPADAAGLRKGIAILSAGDRKFKDAAEFGEFVKGLQAGTLLVLTIDDEGIQSELKVLLEKKK